MDFAQLEKARQTYSKKIWWLIAIFLVVAIGASISAVLGISFIPNGAITELGKIASFSIVIVIAIIAIVAYAIVVYKDAKNYKKLYKSYFVERSLSQIFTDIRYNHTTGMPKETLKQTEMINTGNVYNSNDYFSGKYHDVALSQADVHIQVCSTDSKGNTTYITIFKGRWMVFEFPKTFTFRLQVVDKHFAAKRIPKTSPITKRKIERISTESITFDRKFDVFAEDGFEAYYILDPSLINNIEKLAECHKGRLLLCFIDNKLSVGIDDRSDAFEPPNPLKRLDEIKETNKVSQDIKSVTDFVDFLQLDHKLFKTNQGAK